MSSGREHRVIVIDGPMPDAEPPPGPPSPPEITPDTRYADIAQWAEQGVEAAVGHRDRIADAMRLTPLDGEASPPDFMQLTLREVNAYLTLRRGQFDRDQQVRLEAQRAQARREQEQQQAQQRRDQIGRLVLLLRQQGYRDRMIMRVLAGNTWAMDYVCRSVRARCRQTDNPNAHSEIIRLIRHAGITGSQEAQNHLRLFRPACVENFPAMLAALQVYPGEREYLAEVEEEEARREEAQEQSDQLRQQAALGEEYRESTVRLLTQLGLRQPAEEPVEEETVGRAGPVDESTTIGAYELLPTSLGSLGTTTAQDLLDQGFERACQSAGVPQEVYEGIRGQTWEIQLPEQPLVTTGEPVQVAPLDYSPRIFLSVGDCDNPTEMREANRQAGRAFILLLVQTRQQQIPSYGEGIREATLRVLFEEVLRELVAASPLELLQILQESLETWQTRIDPHNTDRVTSPVEEETTHARSGPVEDRSVSGNAGSSDVHGRNSGHHDDPTAGPGRRHARIIEL